MSSRGVFRAAGIIAAVTIVSKLLGFVRETSLAAVFGATHATDAYLVGQTVPLMVFASLSAALSTTFIPIYAQVRQAKGKEAGFAATNTIVNSTVLLSLLIVGIGELWAAPMVKVVAPGFVDDVFRTTVLMTRIMFPLVPLQTLWGLFQGMIQTEEDFLTPALVGLSPNLVIIASVLVLGPTLGIAGVAAGTVAATAVSIILLMPALRRIGYRWAPVLDLRNPALARVLVLTGPVILGASVRQINGIVDRMLASRLAEGSISALNYGNKLTVLAPTIFGSAIVTVMYPTLSKLAAERDWRRFAASLSEAAGMLLFVLVPVAVGMMALRVPLVQLVFQRGAFDSRATDATAWALLFFALGSVAFVMRDLLNRAFFSVQDTTAPMATGAVAVAINVVLNLLLVGPLKHGGLALATSLSGVYSAASLLWLLRRKVRTLSNQEVRGIGGGPLLSSLWRVTVAAVMMGLVVGLFYRELNGILPGAGNLVQAVRLLAAAAVGTAIYGGMVLLLKVPEALLVVRQGTRLLARWRGNSATA